MPVRKKKTNKASMRRPALRLRWKPLVATLLCGLCIAATLLAPRAVLQLHDGRILDTFYPVELSGASLANPELAKNVSLANTVAVWTGRGGKTYEYLDGQELENAHSALLQGLEDLYMAGLLPPLCMAVARYFPDMFGGPPEMERAVGEASGFALEEIIVNAYIEGRDNYTEYYYSLRTVMHEGKIIFLEMMVDAWGDEEILEAAMTAELVEEALAGQSASQVYEERAGEEPPDDGHEAMMARMERYIAYLGLETLDDWRIINGDGDATATSNFSMLSLSMYWWDYIDSAHVVMMPQY